VRRPSVWLLAVLLAGLAACGGDPAAVSWRDLSLQMPDGWVVFEESENHLSISNAQLGPTAEGQPGEQPEGDVVAMFFTHQPGVQPGQWRDYVEDHDGTLESDDANELAEVPAPRLVFRYDTFGTPMREMVVVIPARQVVVLAQPVPAPGETGGPDTFLRFADTFLEILETIDWGPPITDAS
jgi:hypothetical protein